MNKVQKKRVEAREPVDKRERMLLAAQAIIAAHGLRALKVRDIALAAGTSVGGVYLVFADVDALVVAVNRRTLSRLDAILAAADGADARGEIHALAAAYLAFAVAEPNLLRSLFTHRMQDKSPFPGDLLSDVDTMFARLDDPLSRILTDRPAGAVTFIARTMFSAFHGIVTMGIEERIVALPPARLREQVAFFVDTFLAGLEIKQ